MKKKIPESSNITPSDYIIIGGAGDLSLRKIIPALFWRFLDNQINNESSIIICVHNQINIDQLKTKLIPYCIQAIEKDVENKDKWSNFFDLITIVVLDVVTGLGADSLSILLKKRIDIKRPFIFYLAISSSLFGHTCRLIEKEKLNLPQSRLVVEKPIGHNKLSAIVINNQLSEFFEEHQIYRIDHYLGKETVQNLMALRFANTIFENQWDNKNIDNVQITVAETIGVADRISYYNEYGAIRDMLQNHLLQLICLVAMEPPSYFDANQVRDEKLRVLKALKPLDVAEMQVGQYQGYDSELGKISNTETFVSLKVSIDNWRWAGVPFYIRTGKKMSIRASEIIITFKKKPHDIFSKLKDGNEDDTPNRLIIRVQPQEGLKLKLTSKAPGPGGMRFFPSELNLSFGDTFADRLPDAYERLLMDVARGNQTLFMRLDEVLAAWDFIDPIVEIAKQNPPQLYRAGTMGPEDTILLSNGHLWLDPKDDKK
jgi:glucose-6-phosphate 1-dehydrogenase